MRHIVHWRRATWTVLAWVTFIAIWACGSALQESPPTKAPVILALGALGLLPLGAIWVFTRRRTG
jgi:hypothetical protein